MALIHLKVGNADDPEFLKLGNMMTPVLGNGGDPGAFLSGELGWPLTYCSSQEFIHIKPGRYYEFTGIQPKQFSSVLPDYFYCIDIKYAQSVC